MVGRSPNLAHGMHVCTIWLAALHGAFSLVWPRMATYKLIGLAVLSVYLLISIYAENLVRDWLCMFVEAGIIPFSKKKEQTYNLLDT